MYKKLQLDGSLAYELSIGTNIITKMLVDFLDGKCVYKSLGKEQGDVPKWDDFILLALDGTQLHYQIKEQYSDFSTQPVTKGFKKSGPNKGDPEDLSEFDKTILALLAWYKNLPDPATSKTKKFILSIPSHRIDIKKDVSILVLSDFCEQINSLTTVAGLQASIAADKRFQNLYEWLTSWCGFVTVAEVLAIFSLFGVKAWNSVTEINEKTEDKLVPFFNTPGTVRLEIENIIRSDNNFTTLTPSKYVWQKVHGYVRSDKLIPWSKYIAMPSGLFVSGNQDLLHEGEEPTAIVNGIWNTGRPCQLYLKMNDGTTAPAILESLARICLHLPGGHIIHACDSLALIAQIKEDIGGTLGNDEIHHLPIYDKHDISNSAVERKLGLLREQDKEAADLADEMLKLTWNMVASKVAQLIAATNNPLRDELESRWVRFQEQFNGNDGKKEALLRSMMHPQAERRSIKADLRVGIQTAHLLAEAVHYQLIVLAALGATPDAIDSFDNISIQTIALRTWSGPVAAATKKVRDLSQNAESWLGQEPAGCVIIPQIPVYKETLQPTTMAETTNEVPTISDGFHHKAIITGNEDFKELIDAGDLAGLTVYIRNAL